MTDPKYQDDLDLINEIDDNDTGGGEPGTTKLAAAMGRVLVEMASDIADGASGGSGGEVEGTGVAGTPAGGVLSVQGVAGGTALPVSVAAAVAVTDNGGSLTVDGTVAVSGTVAVTDNAGSLTVDGTVAVSSVGGTVAVSDGGGSLTVDGTVAVSGSVSTANTEVPASTGAVTAVSMTTSSATLIAANSSRTGLMIYNPLGVTLYVRLENADAAARQSFWVLPGALWEMPRRYYTGIVKAAVASATGDVFVTELT